MAWVNCCNSNLPPTWHFFSPQTTQLWSQTIQNAVSSDHSIVFDGSHQTAFRVWYKLQVWYLLSVGVPFRGDHIGLRRNPLWKEVLAKKQPPENFCFKKRIFEVLAKNSLQRMDRFVVFADIVNKINRSNGKARVRVEACLLTIAFCFVCLRLFAKLGLQIWNNRKSVPLVGPHSLREWRVTNFACCRPTIPNSLRNNSRV